MQCEHILHSTMWLSGLKSESKSIPESVSVNVDLNKPNKPLGLIELKNDH